MSTETKFDEILARLDGLHGKTPLIPLIDPTANVIALQAASDRRQDDLRSAEAKLRDAEFRRIDDLRQQEKECNDKLQAERQRADSEAKRAEASRIDSLLASKDNNVALALGKQEAQALAQDKRIAVLEQNQYQGVGAAGQRTESRGVSQWVIGLLVMSGFSLLGTFVAALALALHFWK